MDRISKKQKAIEGQRMPLGAPHFQGPSVAGLCNNRYEKNQSQIDENHPLRLPIHDSSVGGCGRGAGAADAVVAATGFGG